MKKPIYQLIDGIMYCLVAMTVIMTVMLVIAYLQPLI